MERAKAYSASNSDVTVTDDSISNISDRETSDPESAAEGGEVMPRVLERDEHSISRRQIDPDALKVMYRLLNHDYKAYLVGGGVRDLLLGKEPKDFDIGTDAPTETVRALFRNSRIIGRRFPINHVYFKGNKIIEVATFRSFTDPDPEAEPELLKRDHTYGTPETDARRRDLTINGLFYDLSNYTVIDYVGGIDDLRNRVIRVIGDPEIRFQEDPVRMIRAVRHAARTGFLIESNTWDAIVKHRGSIELCARARVFEEFIRELRGGASVASFRLMEDTGLLEHLMPALDESLRERPEQVGNQLELTLSRIDDLAADGRELAPSVLFLAVMIGNLSTSFLDHLLGLGHDQLMLSCWCVSPESNPLFSSDQDGPAGKLADDDSEGSEDDHFAKVIRDLFKPLGLSRKECERMERAMYVRYRMFERATSEAGMSPQGIRTTTEHFEDALMVLRLTASDRMSNSILSFWEDVRRSGRDLGSSRKKRGRKRRRRRGGSQGNRTGGNRAGGNRTGGNRTED